MKDMEQRYTGKGNGMETMTGDSREGPRRDAGPEMAPDARFDARPLLAAGEKPLTAILAAVDGVSEGAALRLTAPFEPVPLYTVMSERGFAHRTEAVSPEEWVVDFVRVGITAESTVAEIHHRHPCTAPVLAEHGLDLCCGGDRSLAFVAAAHGLDLSALLAELQAAALEGPGKA